MSTPVPPVRPGPLVFTASYEGVTNTFRIAFVHTPLSPGRRRITWCVIDQYHPVDDPHLSPVRVQIAQGIAECSPKDMFVKEIGRRIALKRAAGQTRDEIRVAALSAYFTRSRRERKPLPRSPVEGESGVQCPVCAEWYMYPPKCRPGWCERRRLAFRYIP